MSPFFRSCLALALLLTTPHDGFAQSNPPCGTFLTKWGNGASGIAVDGSGNVLVSGYNRIDKFSDTGALVTTWGSEGSGEGQFYYPRGVAVDGSGNVFVADSGNRRIQKFTSDGTFLTEWGSYGSGNGQFTYGPFGIAVDGSGHVFATDWAEQCFPFWGCEAISARIQKFSDTGTFLTTWGSPGYGDGQFNGNLYGVAVDGSGNVYVADWGNARIQKFTNTGSFILEWRGFTFPFALAVDGSGHVFVTDTSNNLTSTPARIEVFTNTGTFLTTWGSPGSGDGQFRNGGPQAVAVDGSGHVFVADFDRIKVFTCIPCGNGQVDPDEQCDDGNSVDGDCCSSTCQFEPLNSPCNDHNPCTTGDGCTGTGGCGFTSCNTGMTCNICGSQCTLQGDLCKCG